MTESPATDSWLSDDPIGGDDSTADQLNRRPFARAAVSMLERLREQNDSSVLALIGRWGSGKSSVLNLIRYELSAVAGDTSNEWVLVDFNPWHYQDLPTLQTGFFRELDSSLPSTQSWWKVRQTVAKIGRAVAPAGSLGSLVGVDVSGMVDAAAQWVGGEDSLAKSRLEAERALRAADSPVLVIVDDLDRLSPDELLLVLKLIRLTGRLPGVYYLVSYDEDTLLDSLSRTGLIGGNDPRRALDYLEKIVQIRLDLPPLREFQAEAWVERAFNDFASHFELSISHDESARFGRAYQQHIRNRLTTPRSIKRYFSQIEAFFEPVKNEVDPIDFMLVTWLRTTEPLVYELVVAEKSELLGTGAGWSVQSILSPVTPQARKEKWKQRLGGARVEPGHLNGVADLLGTLFPRFKHAWNELDPEAQSNKSEPRRVGHPDYFDRYFSFGVPSEDIADSVVDLAFSQIVAGHGGAELSRVQHEFGGKTSIITGKLESALRRQDAGASQLLRWLTERYTEIDEVVTFISPRHHVRWLAQSVYLQLKGTEVVDAIDAAARFEEGLAFAAHWLRAADQDTRLDEELSDRRRDYAAAKTRFLELVRRQFDDLAGVNPLEISSKYWEATWEWRRLDSAGFRQWILRCIELGAWPPLDLVARLVDAESPLGTSEPDWRLSSLDLNVVDQVIGLEYLFTELKEELDAWIDPVPARGTVKAQPSSRRSFALAVLKQERDRRFAPQ